MEGMALFSDTGQVLRRNTGLGNRFHPTSGVGLKWIAGHRVREALQPASAQIFMATALAVAADAVSVTQRLKQGCAVIKLRKRLFQQVADTDGHTAARVEIAVRLNRNQPVAGPATVRIAPSHHELERPVHGDFSVLSEPRALAFGAGPQHEFAEFTGFCRREDLLTQGSTAATGD